MKTQPAKTTHPGPALPVPLHIRSILVPLDFSAPSQQTLTAAVAFARRFKAKLILLHVVEPVATPDFLASSPLMLANDQVMAAAHRELTKLVAANRIPRGIVGQVLVRFGRSFHEIADAARTLKVDLIVISTHGYTGLKHMLLGSTAERVVRHAPCPVFVVRACEHESPAP